MPPVTHVTVTAPEGRKTPVGNDDGVEPGGGLLYVTSDVVCRVKLSHTILRSLARRDLILCNMDGKTVASVDQAAAPEELPGFKIDLEARRKVAIAGGAK